MPTTLLLPPPPPEFSDLPTTLLCLVCLMACLLAAGCLGVSSSPTPYKSTMLSAYHIVLDFLFYWRKIRNKMYLHNAYTLSIQSAVDCDRLK